jgi:hypothetical protein
MIANSSRAYFDRKLGRGLGLYDSTNLAAVHYSKGRYLIVIFNPLTNFDFACFRNEPAE